MYNIDKESKRDRAIAKREIERERERESESERFIKK